MVRVCVSLKPSEEVIDIWPSAVEASLSRFPPLAASPLPPNPLLRPLFLHPLGALKESHKSLELSRKGIIVGEKTGVEEREAKENLVEFFSLVCSFSRRQSCGSLFSENDTCISLVGKVWANNVTWIVTLFDGCM